MSSKGSNKNCMRNSKSDNAEIVVANDTDEIIEGLFDSLIQRYQLDLKE